ncbi:MAG TPA: hypothetical protein PK765_06825 [bacterium]|nr:hypothetical protein [bacterium]
MPTKPYRTYVVAGIKDTLQNLVETGFYLYSYEIDHQSRKPQIDETECLAVGEPKQLSDGTKVVGIQYVGPIAARGWFGARILGGEVEITNFDPDRKLDQPTQSKLKRAFKNQLVNFHANVRERWGEEWRFGFFFVDRPNPVSSRAYHIQKENHVMYWNFDDAGKLVPEQSSKGRYYIFAPGYAFDMETGYLLRDGNEVLQSPYDAKLKSEFLRTLANAGGSVLEKEYFLKHFQLQGKDDNEKNKKLRSLVESLIEHEFGKKLGLNAKTVSETILVCPPRQGYRFVGRFSDHP